MIANAQKTWIVLALGSAVAAVGCGPQFDPPSRVDSLRVLAVQKDRPYAKPGDRVRLTMLWVDGSESAGAERPIQIAWLAGCHNPLGDLYAGCFTGSIDELETGMGNEFSFSVPEDIISSRPPPPDPRQPRYGLSYVFFAACAGTLTPAATSAGFPLVCLGANGEALDSDDFVAGYTAVYAYERIENANPIVSGISIDGRPLAAACIDPASAAAAASGDLGELLGGTGDEPSEPLPVCDGDAPAEPEAPDCAEPNAPCFPGMAAGELFGATLDVRPEIYRASIEQDSIAKIAYGRDYEEQMWINYYATRGSLRTDVRLLNDATTGLNEQFSTQFNAPLVSGPVTLWAVVHDNRGGAAWARGTLWIE